jgi:hypothetical protein
MRFLSKIGSAGDDMTGQCVAGVRQTAGLSRHAEDPEVPHWAWSPR